MKEIYEELELKVVQFDTEDTILMSGGGIFGDNDAENPWGDEDLG